VKAEPVKEIPAGPGGGVNGGSYAAISGRCIMIRYLLLALTLVLAGTPALSAQTGPQGKPPTAQPAAADATTMNPERLAAWLRQQGSAPEMRQMPDGARVLASKIRKDDWNFEVQFEFTPDGKALNLICLLEGAQTSSRERLFVLLRRNYDLGGLRHFSIRDGDQRICLEDNNHPTANLSDTALAKVLDDFLRIVRDTYPLWGNPAPQQGGG
jgi:hypothetical protein